MVDTPYILTVSSSTGNTIAYQFNELAEALDQMDVMHEFILKYFDAKNIKVKTYHAPNGKVVLIRILRKPSEQIITMSIAQIAVKARNTYDFSFLTNPDDTDHGDDRQAEYLPEFQLEPKTMRAEKHDLKYYNDYNIKIKEPYDNFEP